MKQIRKCVFETNSSSSHSLTMSEGDVRVPPFAKETARAGTLFVSVGEYGWEWYRYYQLEGKLSYLLTQATSGKLPEVKEDPEALTRELREENAQVDMLCRVVEEFTGVKVLITYGEGYVDHDSEGAGLGLFDSEAKLKQFLFSDSYIETSNNNSCAPKSIETDRGYEEYYIDSYASAPADYRSIDVLMKGFYGIGNPHSVAGTALDEAGSLWADIKEKGVALSAEWQMAKGGFNPFKYLDATSYSMNELVSQGLKFVEALQVTTPHGYDKGDEAVLLRIKVPADVALAFKELK